MENVKTFNKASDMGYEEAEEFAKELHCWLKQYTDEVIIKVMNRIDEIVADQTTMNFIHEHYIRKQKEEKNAISHFRLALGKYGENCRSIGIHNNVLEHAGAYATILADMWIW